MSKINKHIIFIFLGTFLLSSMTFAYSEEFILETLDKETSIGGQIDYPENCGAGPFKPVMIVGGTGLYYRNGYQGLSGTPRDFVFKDIAERLNKMCLAVVRYDFRGVSCDLKDDETIEKCLDQDIRKKVTAETIIDDIQIVYDHATAQRNLRSEKLVMLGHSEGTLNIARLYQRGTIKPAGLVFLGGITESPRSLLRWQFVDRSVQMAFEFDTNKDGILTNLEVIDGYPNSFFDRNDVPILNLLSPTGWWNELGLYQFYSLEFVAVLSATLNTPNLFPYRQGGLVYSNIAWWKTWFTDKESVLKKLEGFQGPITYFNGTADIQAPGRRQLDFLNNYEEEMQSNPKFVLVKDKGHLLSDHPLYGPIDLPILSRVLKTIQESSL